MKLIAFVGMPASGKSVAAEFAKNLKIPVVNMGDIIREETKKRGLKPSDENIGGIGTELRKKEGMDAVAKRCIPKIRSYNSPIIVIDGTRNKEEIECFKKEFGDDFKLIAINSPLEVRFERIKNRARSDDMNKIEELKKRDEREKSWGLEKAIEISDKTIDNTNSIEKFHKEIEKLFKEL